VARLLSDLVRDKQSRQREHFKHNTAPDACSLRFCLFVVGLCSHLPVHRLIECALQRARFAWTDSIVPLQNASKFTVLAGYFEAANSPTFYLTFVFLSGSVVNSGTAMGCSPQNVFLNPALNFICCTVAWAALFLGMSLWAIHEFANARIPPMSTLHVLRSIANFSAGIGFIPILRTLLSTLNCGGDFNVPDGFWAHFNFECFAGSHLALTIIGVSLAVGFVCFVAVFMFVFVNSNPLSPGLEGQSSGRANVLMLLWKVHWRICCLSRSIRS
jgi:hypothetical protein